MAFQRRRLAVLFLLLALTLLAVWLAPKSPDTVLPIDRATGAKRGTLPTNGKDTVMMLPQTVLAIEPRTFKKEGGVFLDAIGVAPPPSTSSRKLSLRPTPKPTQSLQPQMPITAASSPISPSPNSASLPFKVLGYVILKGEMTVLVQHLNQNLAVKMDDTILEQYKVESITTNQLTLRNLTLNQVQVVPIQSTP